MRAESGSTISAQRDKGRGNAMPLAADAQELRMAFRHRRLPLEINVRYGVWGDTGVFTRALTLANTGSRPIEVESAPSLAWRLPAGECQLTYLWGGWGQERQVAAEELRAGRRAFRGGPRTLGQWIRALVCPAKQPVGCPLSRSAGLVGMCFDFGVARRLDPGATFELPRAAFAASARSAKVCARDGGAA
jgi:hypothetical protein